MMKKIVTVSNTGDHLQVPHAIHSFDPLLIFLIPTMAAPSTKDKNQSHSWITTAKCLPYPLSLSVQGKTVGRQTRVPVQYMFVGKRISSIPRKLCELEENILEPPEAEKDGSALVHAQLASCPRNSRLSGKPTNAANLPESRLEMLRTASIPHSPGLDMSLLAGYAETTSTDEEVKDIPYAENPIDSPPKPYAENPIDSPPKPSASSLRSAGLKRTAAARADEWDSSDTDDDAYTPTNIKTKGKDTEKSKHDTRNVRRREKYASDTQETSQRPKKIVKLSMSPKAKEKETSTPPRENVGVKPEFERGKRVVKRDSYSQTPTAIDYRKRKVVEKELEGQLREMIDKDIIEQVEAEGWITPVGRLFKAGVRMMERVQREREGAGVVSKSFHGADKDSQTDKIQTLEGENNRLTGAVTQIRQILESLSGVE